MIGGAMDNGVEQISIILHEYKKLLNAKCENCGKEYHSCRQDKHRFCVDCRGLQELNSNRRREWRKSNRFHDNERDKQLRIKKMIEGSTQS